MTSRSHVFPAKILSQVGQLDQLLSKYTNYFETLVHKFGNSNRTSLTVHLHFANNQVLIAEDEDERLRHLDEEYHK